MSKPFMIRQGDVLVMSAPKQLKAKAGAVVPRSADGRVILAAGEVTGHHHAIAERGCELRTLPDTDDRFLSIMAASGCELVHEEHDTIVLPPGEYVVRIQREYTAADMAPIRVAD
jgi:hypothetical protein